MCTISSCPEDVLEQHKFGPGAPCYTEPGHCQRDSDSPGVSDSRSCALLSCLLPSPQLPGRTGRCDLKPPREESMDFHGSP